MDNPPPSSHDPAQSPPEPAESADNPGYDALRRLEARLDRASEAAERLLAEATARAAAGAAQGARGTEGAGDPAAAGTADGHEPEAATGPDSDPGEPPPAGWQAPEDGASQTRRDLDLLVNLVQSVRDLVPAELQRRLAEALRELLLALRALIDWYLERMERRRAEPVRVQDIPIQ